MWKVSFRFLETRENLGLGVLKLGLMGHVPNSGQWLQGLIYDGQVGPAGSERLTLLSCEARDGLQELLYAGRASI